MYSTQEIAGEKKRKIASNNNLLAALNEMGFLDLAEKLETYLNQLEEENLIKNVCIKTAPSNL